MGLLMCVASSYEQECGFSTYNIVTGAFHVRCLSTFLGILLAFGSGLHLTKGGTTRNLGGGSLGRSSIATTDETIIG